MPSLLKNSVKGAMVLLAIASVSMVGAQTLRTLVSFNSIVLPGRVGYMGPSGLTLGDDGNFYGTTDQGGLTNSTYPYGMGTVFTVTTNGAFTSLVSFNNTIGSTPSAGLTVGADGNFYGTTARGDSNNYGTVFTVMTNGALTCLYSFSNTNGANPNALTLGPDGNFYGTTFEGGVTNSSYPYGMGTVFKVTTNGTLSSLVSFSGTNGANPTALTLGPDGNFYGSTEYGGGNNYGTVFTVTTNGTLMSLVSFNGTNGSGPVAAPTLGNDGNFYGTTSEGGNSGGGTVFKVTTNGTLTRLVSFVVTNGLQPDAALTVGNDGNFYGTTTGGGTNGGNGTVFLVTTNGKFVTLFSFNNTNGAKPNALTLGSDGNFYGTTQDGGSNFGGTVFCLLLPPVIITMPPQSQTNNAGATVVFLVGATGLNPMSFQWQRNGTNLVDGGNITGATTNALTITGISDTDATVYSVIVSNANGTVTNYATLTVIDPPIITAQPTNVLVLTGANVAFGVSQTGSTPYFHYQWQFNGTNLMNATNSVYTISAVTTNKAGNYSVVVTNAAGRAVSSNAALSVLLSPKSQTNYASSTAIFTVTAFSPESLNFQWQKNGTNLANVGNISGANNSTLIIANLSDADAATYSAVVSDAANSVTISNATLTVNDSLFIATQPLSQAVAVGNNVTFTAKTYGAPPFIFQWYYSNSPAGSPTSGTNVSSYTLTNVHINQSGNYKVKVINGLGSLLSSNAVLTVFLRPTLDLQLLAGYPMLNLNGMLSKNFVVQYNTNLAGTNWTTLLSLTNLQTSPYQFLDPAGSVQPARFYRVWMQ